MKKYTVEDVRNLGPCYDPIDKVPEDWQGTVIDILKLDNVDPEDRIWVVLRYLSDKQNRLFAVWCAREALKLIDSPDQRSIDACNVAEKFANGEASRDELYAARDAAWDAAWAATSAAARAAAWDAAWAAAWDAARDAASAAASAATSAAAWDAAWAAAWDAAWDAARDAASAAASAATWDAAWDAAWDAVRDKQLKRLIKAIENKEWD